MYNYGRKSSLLLCVCAFFGVPDFRAFVYPRLIEYLWYSQRFLIVDNCSYSLLKSFGMDVSPEFKTGYHFKSIRPLDSISW
jgi:hypothetical protein